MNALIAEQFNLLVKQIQAEYLNAQMENDVKEITMHKYRLQNIKKILSTIKKLDFEIKNVDDLKGIPGLGAGTVRRVKEILETGQLSELKNKYDKKKQATIDSILELEKVIGIGKETAKKFVIDNGITSINDLKKAIKMKKITVNDKILLGLKYYGIVEGDIPRKETGVTVKYLTKEAHKIDPALDVMICGSYRRGKKTSGDLDILLYHPDAKVSKNILNPKAYGLEPYLELYVSTLTENGFLIDDMTDKDFFRKYMGFCKYNNYPVRRIDIRYVPYNSLSAAMLYFTGPAELNKSMREKAKQRNMSLNEYGLYKLDKDGLKTLIPIQSEEDIFKILGMDYLTPEEREQFSVGKIKITK